MGWLDYRLSEPYFYVSTILYSLCLVFMTILLVVSAKTNWAKYQKSKGDELQAINRYMWWSTFGCVFYFWMTSVFAFVTRILTPDRSEEGTQEHTCLAMVKVIGCSYAAAKGAMYMVMTLRVYSAFKASPRHAIKPQTVGIYCAYIGLVTVGSFLHVIVWAESKYDYSHGKWLCTAIYVLPGVIWTSLNDIIITVSLLYLFLVPLRHLRHEYRDDDKKQLHVINLSTKYAILSTTGTVTSLIALFGLALTRFSALGVIDGLVSSLCLTLMARQFNDTYRKICFCCMPFHYMNAAQLNLEETNDGKTKLTMEIGTHASSTTGNDPSKAGSKSPPPSSAKDRERVPTDADTVGGVEQVQTV